MYRKLIFPAELPGSSWHSWVGGVPLDLISLDLLLDLAASKIATAKGVHRAFCRSTLYLFLCVEEGGVLPKSPPGKLSRVYALSQDRIQAECMSGCPANDNITGASLCTFVIVNKLSHRVHPFYKWSWSEKYSMTSFDGLFFFLLSTVERSDRASQIVAIFGTLFFLDSCSDCSLW